MIKSIQFLEPAVAELDDAINYYNLQIPKLGEQFLREVFDSIKLIVNFPEMFSKFSENTRRIVLKRFPYSIIYSIRDNNIYIIAIAHQNREPNYWISRSLNKN